MKKLLLIIWLIKSLSAVNAQTKDFITPLASERIIYSKTELVSDISIGQSQRLLRSNKRAIGTYAPSFISTYQLPDSILLISEFIGTMVANEIDNLLDFKNQFFLSNNVSNSKYSPQKSSVGINLCIGSCSQINICSIKSISGTPFIDGFNWIAGISWSLTISGIKN